MPEGDTIHKLARQMEPLVVGKPITALHVRQFGDVASVRGQTVTSVRAIGKHMLVSFSNQLCLRVHLGVAGKWRRFSADRPLPRWAFIAPVRLAVADHVLVCAKAKETQILSETAVRTHSALRALGPDLLGETFSWEAIHQRLTATAQSGRAIADVLLDQRIAAGIGNVYKSEVLFLEGVHPSTPLSKLDATRLRRIYERARSLLLQNLRPGPRVTTRPSLYRVPIAVAKRYWVYGRAHEPCRRCQTRIDMQRRGDDARPTYFCPRCQSVER
jgi:endonuclease-8